ncbi:hypothetical protein SAMN05444004_10196 [Jannaschia faecimaris]|uniref:Glycerophosphoryl diester phosphodiesterase membrane domain-containing protein n=1 Tax=Jannaschia faecimaris TaxID=1244108 RepID=A0A1H3IS73_9RHOB|nr:hypothetical protein [Jannaschia faecimaris]SDY30606.1 hypothetical protein SAMN05444004_10196 [Jannaschia faecimaris]
MLGWKLFVRALTLITDNLMAAMKVSLVPYALAVGAGLWVALSYPEWVGVPLDPENPPPPGFVLGTMGSLLVGVLASLWISVGWHRFALLGEQSGGWVPRLNGNLMLGYFGRTLLTFLMALLAAIAVITMLVVLLVPLFGESVQAIPAVGGFFAACLVFYRIGVILPAGAAGKPMKMGEALIATKGQAQTIIVLALLTVGVTLLLRLPLLIEETNVIISTLYQFVTGWIGLMLGVGTLTALYGHLVEGRPLD